MSEKYDKWPTYTSVVAFRTFIEGHSKVSKLELLKEHHYIVHRTDDLPPLRVVHSNIYILSEADVYELYALGGNLNAIVLAGFWNSYTDDAKNAGMELGIAVFNFKEFFGALNYKNDKFINYETPPLPKKDK